MPWPFVDHADHALAAELPLRRDRLRARVNGILQQLFHPPTLAADNSPAAILFATSLRNMRILLSPLPFRGFDCRFDIGKKR